ncbi:hypothetical protein O3P69_001609 [Scylla paramamosain]|uniref:Uncharacterized protein n=1 Tax=Scylla paramamosain TaxID=85552 RepID=A0AAW0V2Q9_SCYPA
MVSGQADGGLACCREQMRHSALASLILVDICTASSFVILVVRGLSTVPGTSIRHACTCHLTHTDQPATVIWCAWMQHVAIHISSLLPYPPLSPPSDPSLSNPFLPPSNPRLTPCRPSLSPATASRPPFPPPPPPQSCKVAAFIPTDSHTPSRSHQIPPLPAASSCRSAPHQRHASPSSGMLPDVTPFPALMGGEGALPILTCTAD